MDAGQGRPLALAVLFGCAPTPGVVSVPLTSPVTFVEAEPGVEGAGGVSPSGAADILIALGGGLQMGVHATPTSGDRGTAFKLAMVVQNTSPTDTIELGLEPLVWLGISVLQPNGNGFGSGGGCPYSSHPSKNPLAPGEQIAFERAALRGGRHRGGGGRGKTGQRTKEATSIKWHGALDSPATERLE